MNESLRISVVAGGTGAIGGAVVDRLVDDGLRVVVPARDPELVSLADGVAVLRCDLGNDDDIARLEREVARRGLWHSLVVATGGYAKGAAHLIDDDLVRRQLETNLLQPWRIARRAVRVMLEHGDPGRIVMVGSRASVRAEAGAAAYQVSKAALARLVDVMALELRESRITVNAVLPSTVDTAANRASMRGDPAHWVPAADVADAVAWLLSDEAGSTSGALVPVYGRA